MVKTMAARARAVRTKCVCYLDTEALHRNHSSIDDAGSKQRRGHTNPPVRESHNLLLQTASATRYEQAKNNTNNMAGLSMALQCWPRRKATWS